MSRSINSSWLMAVWSDPVITVTQSGASSPGLTLSRWVPLHAARPTAGNDVSRRMPYQRDGNAAHTGQWRAPRRLMVPAGRRLAGP